jgi:hypothetical protein
MKVWQYVLALLVFIALALATVWQQVRLTRAGYRLHALEQDRERLVEQRRKLEVRRAREERVDVLVERARKLGLALPGEERSDAGRD